MIQGYPIKKKSSSIIVISLGCLLIGQLFNPNNLLFSFWGFAIISFLVYHITLKKNDIFTFVIILYFCSLFRYWSGHGGAFNYISLLAISAYWLRHGRLPNEHKVKNKLLAYLIVLFYFSSLIGWIVNYVGSLEHLILSVTSFTGLILLFFVSSSLVITKERIKIFLQINLFLAVYSLIASINKFLGVITFDSPMMPIYGSVQSDYYESGGIIGVSPMYGEFSMLIFVLFVMFGLFGKGYLIKTKWVYFGAATSILNVFLSISRSAFLLSILGLAIAIIFQAYFARIISTIKNLSIFLLFGFSTLIITENLGLDYVFKRLEAAEGYKGDKNASILDRILDGSAFERKETFDISYEKYYSKSSWIIGYGWGLSDDNRNAFYLNVDEKITSVHSQFWAILFLFGWFGLIIYYLFYFIVAWNSLKVSIFKSENLKINELLAFYFLISHILFLLNEIKIDSIYIPGYFAVTMILLGLSYSNLTTLNQNINRKAKLCQ